MILLATVHVFMSSRALMEPGGFLGSLEQWFSMLSKGTYIAQELLGNGVIMYRTWILWDRRWKVIAVPCCSLLLLTGVGSALLPKISYRIGNIIMRVFSLMILILNIGSTYSIALQFRSLAQRQTGYHIHPHNTTN
ncbi:hypothetical protein L218DRAFT_950192 [Marasmius fiardii PR-910]|nr:hypothetical protein L218DRAFT_950192 [Marasmius fiardii PR-910]